MSKSLMQALMNMHAEFGVILEKDKKGNRGTYTSLPGVLSQIHHMTKKHGLILTQEPFVSAGHQMLKSVLSFVGEDGETEETRSCESMLTPATNNPSPDQAWGGSLTYHRRYDAMALLGLFCDEDPSDHDGWKDHEAAQPVSSVINDKQVGLLKFKLMGKDDIKAKIVNKYGSLENVPANMMNAILQSIEGA